MSSASAIHPFSSDPGYDFEIRTVLGHAGAGASSIGEVLEATAGLGKKDHRGWFEAWMTLGERSAAIAKTCAEQGHRVSAAEAYLHASTYFGVAVNAMSSLPDANDLTAVFGKQLAAWEGFIAHTSVNVEPVDIPLSGTSMPGYLFRPDSAVATGATLVAVNGSDGSLASLWASCVSAALQRGYAVLVFDGPGQQSQFFQHGIPFRADWENILTPVYDFMAAQPGVDPARVGLYGISQAGYWVPRALSVEHRYAAAIADPGIVDVSDSWTRHVPGSLLKLLDAGETAKFDQEMGWGMKLSPETARDWQFRARPYGAAGYAETLLAVREYRLTDEQAAAITTPLLITNPEGEQFWPGQSERLATLTPGVSTVLPFAASEGADGHCEPLARPLAAQRMFDWLDEHL